MRHHFLRSIDHQTSFPSWPVQEREPTGTRPGGLGRVPSTGRAGSPLAMSTLTEDAASGPAPPKVLGKLPGGLAPSSVHVLLVDDERLSRTVVASLLRKCNYKGEGGSTAGVRRAGGTRCGCPAGSAPGEGASQGNMAHGAQHSAPRLLQSPPPTTAPRRWSCCGRTPPAPTSSSSR